MDIYQKYVRLNYTEYLKGKITFVFLYIKYKQCAFNNEK